MVQGHRQTGAGNSLQEERQDQGQWCMEEGRTEVVLGTGGVQGRLQEQGQEVELSASEGVGALL